MLNFIFLLIIGGIFSFIGFILPKCEQNYFIGIRTKWTLENKENWIATHKMCSKVWIIGGLFIIACFLLSEVIIPWALIGIIMVLVIIPVVYSYAYYNKQLKDGSYVATEISECKNKKVVLAFVIFFIILTIIFCIVLCFTGDIKIEHKDDHFDIIASYWSDLSIFYDDIDSIEFRENFNKGFRIYGFGTPKLSMGSFKNNEFDVYTIYSYTNCSSVIVLGIDDKIIVINGENHDDTKQIYETLKNKGISKLESNF